MVRNCLLNEWCRVKEKERLRMAADFSLHILMTEESLNEESKIQEEEQLGVEKGHEFSCHV